MNAPVPVEAFRRVVRQNDAEIQIAVRPAFPSCFRAKEVDANGVIELDQPPGDLFDLLLFVHDLSHYPSYSHFRVLVGPVFTAQAAVHMPSLLCTCPSPHPKQQTRAAAGSDSAWDRRASFRGS